MTGATGVAVPRYAGRLEPEHLALVDELRAQWMAVGLSTDRVDRAAAEAAVAQVYRAAGLDPAPVVLWMDSPLGGALAATAMGQLGGPLLGQLGGELRGHLLGQLDDQLGGELRGHLLGQLGGQLRGQLWGQLDDQLGGQLHDQLHDQLWDQLRGQLWGQLDDQLGGQLRGHLRGQLGDRWTKALSLWGDAYWACFYAAALPIAGLPASPRLDAIAAAIASVDHWWPMRGAVVLTDRPTVIGRDGQGRLHSLTGPALAYADGWAVHAVHGVRVPGDIISDPDSITVARILAEPNTEVRRTMIDVRGWDWFVAAAGLVRVDEAPDPGNPGEVVTLWDLPEQVYDEPVRVAVVTNASPERDGTRRRYGLTVPADCQTAVGAIAWTFGVDGDTYRSLERAT